MVPMSVQVPDTGKKAAGGVFVQVSLLRGSASSTRTGSAPRTSRFLSSLLQKVHGNSEALAAAEAEEACDCPCAQEAAYPMYVQQQPSFFAAPPEAVYANVDQRWPQPQPQAAAYYYNLPGLSAVPPPEPMEF